MFRKSFLFMLSVWLFGFSIKIFAASHFVIRQIDVQGLQRVSEQRVLSVIPIHVGQTFQSQQSADIIKAIYATGFFEQVNLKRQDNTLIIQVVESPTIDSIDISGNKSIKAKELKPVLKNMGIVVGKTYHPYELEMIVKGLQQQYALLGKASASVTPNVKKLSRNRVALSIKIEEGAAVIIREIHIEGNKAFSERILLSQFKLSTPGIFSWFTKDDRYSSMRLDQDLQSLQNFYYDHGYLEYRLVSKDVVHLPNAKGVTIHLAISEGPQFRISGYRVDAHIPKELSAKVNQALLKIKSGSVFSRAQIMALDQEIAADLANLGYAFPQIAPMPQLDDANKTVFIDFKISSGNRVYVHQIHLVGNTRTSGTALRTQFRQYEGSIYSQKNIEESKRRLSNLGYLDNIDISTARIPDKPNQVDLTYKVHEVNAGKASVQAGYSDVDGFLYGASLTEPNFAGTGRYVGLSFQRSKLMSSYNFSYSNPFYSNSGVSRGFNVFYNHATPNKNNMDPYTMDTYGASVNYGIPINEYDQVTLGGGYNHNAISIINTQQISPSITDFLALHHSPFNQFKVNTGYLHSTLDRIIFPQTGNEQNLNVTMGVPVIKSSLPYYQVTYDARWYWSLGHGFIISPHTSLGYGNGYGKNDRLPFFNNFYAGGLQTLPGYEANSLGPKNPNNLNQALGGNVQLLAGLNFILPDFISHTVRSSLIFNAGNVFQTHHVPRVSYESVSVKNLRYTAGIMVSWWSPLGAPLDFSLAWPLNKKPGDQLAVFGFSFGATL